MVNEIEETEEGVLDSEMMNLINAKKDEGKETDGEETVEVKTEEVKEVVNVDPEPKESKSDHYVRLVEKDRKIVELERALKAQQSSVGQDLRELAKSDPLKALEQLGILPDQLLDIWSKPTEDEKPEPVVPKEVDELRKEIENLKNERLNERVQSQYNEQMAWLDKLVVDGNDKWQVIGALKDEGSYQHVLEVAMEVYKNTNQVPDMELLLDHVESDLEKHYMGRVNKYTSIPKLAPQKETVVVEKKRNITLNNSLSAETQPNDDSDEAKRERAWLIMQKLNEEY